MSGLSATHRERLESLITEKIGTLPGVARLAPSFREALTATTKELIGAEDTQASGVDINTSDARVMIYIDIYTDVSRPAGSVVDDIHAQVATLLGSELRDSAVVKVRVLGISPD